MFFAKSNIIIVALFAPFLICITSEKTLISKVFSSKVVYFLGFISYPLYLVHFIIAFKLSDLQQFLSNLWSTQATLDELFIVYLTITLIFSTAFTYLLEVPTISYLNRRIFKNKSEVEPTLVIQQSGKIS